MGYIPFAESIGVSSITFR